MYLFLPFFLDLKLLFTCFCNVNCKQLRRCKRSISSPKRSGKTAFDNFLLFESISIFRTFFQQFQTLLSDMLSLSSLFIVLSNCITEYKRVHGISLRSLPIFKSRRFSSSLLTSFKAMRVVIRCLVSNWRCSINESTLFSALTVSSAWSWIWCWELCWASKT